ncbi:alpha/beta hydrolase-fold protein [Bowmanella dokdonensis]|uniref:Esterase n=1 Tax=Bowmanella dokdonensis TaxID=751969 RepID=A0A939DM63_9ALTE|nr:hypothetical protein [Bowmanella dokdonensis]
MIRSVLFCLGLLFGPQAAAYHVEEISVPSQAMDLSHRATVVLPDAYQKGEQPYPVLYLLHGHGGSFQDWAGGTEVEDLADRYQMILVMPSTAGIWTARWPNRAAIALTSARNWWRILTNITALLPKQKGGALRA